MVLKNTLHYVFQPLDTADIRQLRNTAICGISALMMIMIGLPKLLVLIFYLFVIGIVVIVTWLYSLDNGKRAAVIGRIKEVLNCFMQTCVDDALNGNDMLKDKLIEPTEKSPITKNLKTCEGNQTGDTASASLKVSNEYSKLFK